MKQAIKKTKKPVSKKKLVPADKKQQDESRYWEATGRRKTSIARVRLYKKPGEFLVNGKSYKDYFPIFEYQNIFEQPLKRTKTIDKMSGTLKVMGGGIRGQVEASRHGIAMALLAFNADWRKKLKKAGFLRRDPRAKERKKYGLKKARRAPQWSKR